MDALITGTGFDSAAVAPVDRFEAWRAYMAPAQDIRPVPGGGRELSVESIGWALDDLLLGELAFSPVSYRRPGGRAGGCVLLRLYREGHASGVFDDAPFRTAPGEIHLFDQARNSHGVTADWHRLQSIFIPYAAIGYEPGRHPAHLRVDPASVVGRVLRAAIETLFAELPRTRQAEAGPLAAGFAGLVKGLLLSVAPTAGSREFEAARRLAMRRYLEDNLDGPELGVTSLCAAFGASRATVYRDFAEDGGVAHFVMRRRLKRAFRDLASGSPDRGRVRRVAERWGFACPYHFSRAFRRQFGLWPSAAFEAARAPGGDAPPARIDAVRARDARTVGPSAGA
ncbi:MAG: helix-turn-helix domain-containing protein [Geminicoccaceae bacterium]